MSLFRCGGGGNETEEILWTNSTPTTSRSEFSATLNSPYTSFSRIKVIFRRTTADATEMAVEYLTDEIDIITAIANDFIMASPIVRVPSGSIAILAVRPFLFTADNTILFYNCLRVHNTSGAIFNDRAIPISVIGIK